MMTKAAFRGVGLCARMSSQGDWAFDYALDLALENDVRLDIFFFPEGTEEGQSRGRRGELAHLTDEEKIQREKEVRLYYDEMLGDFVNVGFRLCEGDEEPELRRCLLIRREYDVLVLPFEQSGMRFGSKPIERFAESMPCPTILIGPDRPGQALVNTAAKMMAENLRLEGHEWRMINDVDAN